MHIIGTIASLLALVFIVVLAVALTTGMGSTIVPKDKPKEREEGK